MCDVCGFRIDQLISHDLARDGTSKQHANFMNSSESSFRQEICRRIDLCRQARELPPFPISKVEGQFYLHRRSRYTFPFHQLLASARMKMPELS